MVKTRRKKYASPAVSAEEAPEEEFVAEVYADDTSGMDTSEGSDSDSDGDADDERRDVLMNAIYDAETDVDTDPGNAAAARIPNVPGPSGNFFLDPAMDTDVDDGMDFGGAAAPPWPPMPEVRPGPDPVYTDISSTEFEGFSQDEQGSGLFAGTDPGHFSRKVEFKDMWTHSSRPPIHMTFTGKPGMTFFKRQHFPVNPTPLDYFKLFIDDPEYTSMAQETNTYHKQSVADKNLKPHSRLHNWKEVKRDEMKVFIAMTMAMRLVVQGDFTEYWSTSRITNTPFFRTCMSRDRFWMILTYFHLTDNSQQPKRGGSGYSHMNKLGHLYNNLIHKFSTVYKPHKNISVDEGMVPWKGNLSFKVFMKDKPKRYGMKAYMLCDSHNGYVLKFKLYTGKSQEPKPEGGTNFELIKELTREYRNLGHHLFMDNFYSSPFLYLNLWEWGIGATGTARSNRIGLHPFLKSDTIEEGGRTRKMRKGEMKIMLNQGILLGVKYQDRKTVLLMSTIEDAVMVETGKTNWGGTEPITKPRVVMAYNKYMGGVDRADQMLSYTPLKMKTFKWWKRVWFHLLNVAMMNAFLIYKDHTKDKVLMSMRAFRKSVVHDLVRDADGAHVPSLQGRHRSRTAEGDDSITRLQGRHFPSKITTDGKKQHPTRVCTVCSQSLRSQRKRRADSGLPVEKRKRVGRESSYECSDCAVTLCVVPCFEIYHTKKDFVSAYLATLVT